MRIGCYNLVSNSFTYVSFSINIIVNQNKTHSIKNLKECMYDIDIGICEQGVWSIDNLK